LVDRGLAQERQAQYDDEQPGAEQGTEKTADQHRTHRNTRSGSGRRPIRNISRYASTQTTAPAPMISAPTGELHRGTTSPCNDSTPSPSHGPAPATRAPLTAPACRDSSSDRVLASSRRNDDSDRSSRPRSPPPTSRAIRSASTTRSPTGSASRA